MAKVIELGLLPPDHPIYHGGAQVFSHRLYRPRPKDDTAKEADPSPPPPEEGDSERTAEDEPSASVTKRPDEPQDERPRR